MLPSVVELICAGVAVAIFNKYILSRFDPLAYCCAQCCENDKEDDCASSLSTSVVNDACHVQKFYK